MKVLKILNKTPKFNLLTKLSLDTSTIEIQKEKDPKTHDFFQNIKNRKENILNNPKNDVLAYNNDILKRFPVTNNYFLKSSEFKLKEYKDNNTKTILFSSNLESEDAKAIINRINKTIDINTNNTNALVENINTYLNLIEGLYVQTDNQENMNIKITPLIDEYLSIIKFLKQNNQHDIVKDTYQKLLTYLDRLPEIPIDVIINYKGVIDNILNNYRELSIDLLQNVIEKSISTITRLQGSNSIDLVDYYTLLSKHYLNRKNVSNSEEYALKALEVIKNASQSKQDPLYSQIYLILGILNNSFFMDNKEAFQLFNEAYNILNNKNNIDLVNTEKYEIIKFQICHHLGDLYSSIDKEGNALKYYEQCLNTSYSIIEGNIQMIKSLLDINKNLSMIYYKSDYYRKSYECNKTIYNISEKYNIPITNNVYFTLVSLFKYSNDYNINLKYLKNEELAYEYAYFLAKLIDYCLEENNLLSANNLLEIFETYLLDNRIVNEDMNLMLKYNIFSADIKSRVFNPSDAVKNLSSAIEMLKNNVTNLDKTDQINKLIKCHFKMGNINAMMNVTKNVISQYETCIALIRDNKTNDTELMIRLLMILSHCYLLRGDRLKALNYLKNVKQLSEDDYDIIGYVDNVFSFVLKQKE